MKTKIDDRLPRELGAKSLPNHPAIKSPWEKLMSFHDAAHYCQRYSSVLGAAMMGAYRILIPDYAERSKIIYESTYNYLYYINHMMDGFICTDRLDNQLRVLPFCAGNFSGAMTGDSGDESLIMCGRVNDFGTYRTEKELDTCYWDVVGSELCRATTASLQSVADTFAEHRHKGPHLEYHMVEARACGDCHCRIVAECREKYPMPAHEPWECFGPVATADQIKYTPEEEMFSEPQCMRSETGFRFTGGATQTYDSDEMYNLVSTSNPAFYLLPAIDHAIRLGKVDEAFADHVLKCVCEAAGKGVFGEFYAREGLRQFVGAPASVQDGRLMGAHIEMVLQSLRVPYEIEAFNSEEVIYKINAAALANNQTKQNMVYLAFWGGMTRTLVSAEWFLWEEGSTAETLRIKIGKKIDKYC